MATGLTTENPKDKLGSLPSSTGQAEADKATSKPVTSQSAAPDNKNTGTPQASQSDDLMNIAPDMKKQGRSWGDRLKSLAFGITTHVGINYVINTLVAATFTYIFERNFEKAWKRGMAYVIGRGDAAKDPVELHKLQDTGLYKGVNYGFSAVLLTAGGTLMLPFMKHAEENRQYYEYHLSKMLDKTQKMVGGANADTERNLADYKLIEEIAAAKHAGKDAGVSGKEIERLEEKYHFAFKDNGDIEFDKVKISWWEMAKARVAAIAMSMTAGFILGSSKKWGAKADEKEPVPTTVTELEAMEKARITREESGDFGKRGFSILESKAIKPLSDLFKKLPLIGKWFGTNAETTAKTKLVDSIHFAKLLFMDAILTVVSAVTFAFVSGKKEKNEPDKKDIDANKDGWVSKDEVVGFREKHKEANLSNVHVDNVVTGRQHSSAAKKQQPIAQPAASHMDKISTDRQSAKETPVQLAP